MAKQTKFTPRKTPDGWRINIPAKFSMSGRRERHFYRTQELALEAAAKLKADRDAFGATARTASPALVELAVAADALLSPWGVSLLEAARIVAGIKTAEAASNGVEASVDAWLQSCDHLRCATLVSRRSEGRKIKDAFAGRIVSTIVSKDLQDAIAPAGTVGTVTVDNRRRMWRTWWYFCAKQGWCKAEVFGVVVNKVASTSEIAILSVEDARALLGTAVLHRPEMVGFYAVQLFAGIRREEAERLQEAHVTPEGIELGAEITKKGRRRHITPSKTLKAWLTAYPFQEVADIKRRDADIRALAGWKIKPFSVKAPDPTRGEWPMNGLRHSHASYSIAAGVSLESLLFEFGHTGGPTLLRQHYVGRASKKQALEYFAILPAGAAAIPALQAV